VLKFKLVSSSSFSASRNLVGRAQNVQKYLKCARQLCPSPNYPFWASKTLKSAYSRHKLKKTARKSKILPSSFDFELNFLRDRRFNLLFKSTVTLLRISLLHSHANQSTIFSELEQNQHWNTFTRELSMVFSSPPSHHGLAGWESG